MKDTIRDYLIELASGFFNITLLLLDILGIVLLFWPGFLWAQVVGLLIFAFSFGVANFRIYWRQRLLLRGNEGQKAKRLYLLQSLLCEIQANVVSVSSNNIVSLSDDIWQHNRNDIYWLPTELQERLLAHYRALQLLMSAVREGIEKDWFFSRITLPGFIPHEVESWRMRMGGLRKSFGESLQQLPEALQETD